MTLQAVTKTTNVVKKFFNDFFNQSGIHGFLYFGNQFALHIIERLLWLILIVFCLYFCVDFSLESWDRYLHKSTVVTIERDHYYWNTSLPSITICPMERLSRKLFDAYCDSHGIYDKNEREQFWGFMESLANATYNNFKDIKDYPGVDGTLAKLRIKPENYQYIIYNLTENMSFRPLESEVKVRNINNLEFIRSVQTLTEYGICYTTNNFLATNLSTAWLIDGKSVPEDLDYRQHKLHDVRFGNLFDGDMTYSFIGFDSPIVVFLHSPYDAMNVARGLPWTMEAYEFESYSIEIITSKDFKSTTTVEQRKCRFADESNLVHYNVYTKGLCLQECRMSLALEKCGCIPHFYPNKIKKPKPVCHYQVLKNCFPRWTELLLEFHDHDDEEEIISCACLQNCLDSNVIVEKLQILKGTKNLLGSIGGLIIMKKHPLIRYQREVIFTFTDFLVSIGGTAGLFIGVSVLGIIEIVYYFSLRLIWFIFGFGRD